MPLVVGEPFKSCIKNVKYKNIWVAKTIIVSFLRVLFASIGVHGTRESQMKTLKVRYIFFFFFFLRRYNFREVLAFSMSVFDLVRSLMQSFQYGLIILVISLFTSSSSHLFFGLPSDLVSADDHS